jgi:hypothetical protein
MALCGMKAANLGLDWSLFRKFIRQSREHSRILNPLRVFAEIQRSVVFSLDGSPIAFSSLFDLMQ